MKNYKVFIWDNNNAQYRIYLIAANNQVEAISSFDNIFRNNPEYKFSSMIELVINNIPTFQNVIQY